LLSLRAATRSFDSEADEVEFAFLPNRPVENHFTLNIQNSGRFAVLSGAGLG
jgi:hypothetical protein